jgi:hypothetical protein
MLAAVPSHGHRLRLTLTIAALASLALALSALLGPSTAAADDLRKRDARRDVWHDVRWAGKEPYLHMPDLGRPDLLRTVYEHAGATVRVRIRMREIEAFGYWDFEARFRTNEGLRRTASVFRSNDDPPRVSWSGRRRCGIDHHFDDAGNFFVLWVPRRCLGRPERVAFKVRSRWTATSDDFYYLDVAGSKGYRMRRWSDPVRHN